MIKNDRRPEALEMLGKAIERALVESGEIVTTEAKRLCPVDTSNLRNSIQPTPARDNEIQIGTNVEYAPYVELGTSKMEAQPFLTPAIKGKQEAIANVFRNEIAKMR